MEKIKVTLLAIVFSLLLTSAVQSQLVYPGGGLGSYSLTYPSGPYPLKNPDPILNKTHHFQQPCLNRWFEKAYPKVVSGFSKPIQTNDWWSAHIWDFETDRISTNADLSAYGGLMYNQPGWKIGPYGMASHPHPFSLKGRAYGIDLSSQNGFYISGDGKTLGYNNIMHLNIGIDGMLVPSNIGTKVVDYGDWTVKLLWDDQIGNSLEVTSGHGLPFVYCKKTGGDVAIRYTGTLLCYAMTANSMGLTIDDGSGSGPHHYGIFFPTGSLVNGINAIGINNPPSIFITQDEMEIITNPYTPANASRPAFRMQLPLGKNYFSVAVLPDNSIPTLNLYAQHGFAFVSDSRVNWNYNESTGDLVSTFTLTTELMEGTETRAIQALYPHQFMNSSDINTPYNYQCARGEMRVLRGNTFQTTLKHYGLIPNLPYAGNYNLALLNNLFNNLSSQTSFFWDNYYYGESYEHGKKLGRYSDLIPLAKQINHTAAFNALLDSVRTQLETWFSAGPAGVKSYKMFHYDQDWNTLAAYPVGYHAAGQLNDHHFHYGYFIKAAAMVARYTPGWAAQWGPMVETLIKDVNNWDRTDNTFPFLRFMDPYAGHSWASGHSNFMDGNNQESATEAINFATAVALWGAVTNNSTIRDLGIYLSTTEISTTQHYWWDQYNLNPAPYTHSTSALVWGNKIEYRTWFPPGDPRHIHGINYLPVTGASLFLGYDTSLVMSNYNELLATEPILSTTAPLGTGLVAPKDWRDIVATYVSLARPSIGIALENTLLAEPDQNYAGAIYPYAAFDGTSWQMTHHWLHTLDSIGIVDLTTADFATTNVFIKNGCKHYVIYNPPGYPSRVVNFSDGNSFTVEADTLQVFYWCPVLPVELLKFSAKRKNNTSEITWSTASEENNQGFFIERSTDGVHFKSIRYQKGLGNSYNIKEYNDYDYNPYPGINYYRLRQVDNDGKYSYSHIVSVSFDNNDFIQIYPNPTKDYLVIKNNFLNGSEWKITLTDILGRELFLKNNILSNEEKINIEKFTEGTYYCKITCRDTGFEKTFKVVKW